MVSIHVFAMPMMGFFRSSSVKPMALSMARAGARSRALGDGVAFQWHEKTSL